MLAGVNDGQFVGQHFWDSFYEPVSHGCSVNSKSLHPLGDRFDCVFFGFDKLATWKQNKSVWSTSGVAVSWTLV